MSHSMHDTMNDAASSPHDELLDNANQLVEISLTVNGRAVSGRCEPRKLLVDFLREDLALTGTHAGCEHGLCGACTIHIDGQAARSCTTLAVQVDGARITTIEGLAPAAAVTERLDYVAATLRLLRRELGDRHALLGFGGSPWTLATYMVEGGSADDFERIKELFYADRGSFDAAMRLARVLSA